MTAKDLEGLYDYGYRADRKLFDVISQLTPEEFTRPLAGGYESMMQHAAIHGVHHRGQVAILLRLLGRAPGAFDILVYFAVKGAAPVN